MKKLVFVLFLVSIFLFGYEKQVVENKIEVEKTIPFIEDNINQKGEIIVTTHVSSSEDEKLPIIKIEENVGLWQIGIIAKNFDDSKLSYIYIDKKLNTVERFGKESDVTLTIFDSDLKEGEHKIEIVQFNNDKTSGKPINYKLCNYKVVLNKI